ncbi:hypothetical protein EVAR_60374_1 [Eumeta japonica]|uniref:Uncharacterized protein n=1 Tax=Eumeta variegata TaxID=151549 RepID=A0A4C1ZRH0_EUMVA|nr:hypothetical protein EVAR_60374_1 [Eumeta japonica]
MVKGDNGMKPAHWRKFTKTFKIMLTSRYESDQSGDCGLSPVSGRNIVLRSRSLRTAPSLHLNAMCLGRRVTTSGCDLIDHLDILEYPLFSGFDEAHPFGISSSRAPAAK